MRKILIVDDQMGVRELVNVTLQVNDYEIRQASNGQQAIDIAHDFKPDLILMDIMMPGDIDGLEATRILKGSRNTGNCRIIMLTAKGQHSDVRAGLEAGADDYFIKPFSPLALIEKVENVLRNRAS